MDITLKDKNGVVLHTANKYCEEDIQIGIKTEEIKINPSKEEQVQEGIFNKVTVAGDENLIADNILEGTSIFGVNGKVKVLDTSDATATANDLLTGKTAYINGEKIEGAMLNLGVQTVTPNIKDTATYEAGGYVESIDVLSAQESVKEGPVPQMIAYEMGGGGATATHSFTIKAQKGCRMLASVMTRESADPIVPDGWNLIAYVNVPPTNQPWWQQKIYVYEKLATQESETFTSTQPAGGTGRHQAFVASFDTNKEVEVAWTFDTAGSRRVSTDITASFNEGDIMFATYLWANTSSYMYVSTGNTRYSKYSGGADCSRLNALRLTSSQAENTAQLIASTSSGTQDFGAILVRFIPDDGPLVERNIKAYVNIGGIEGTFTADADATAEDILKDKIAYVKGERIVGEYEPLDTSDATATAADIAKDKTAYVNGQKIIGEMEASTGDNAQFIAAIDETNGANLTELPNELTTIRNYAFYYCSDLALKKIPDSVVKIGNNAFYGCSNLQLDSLSSSLEDIGTSAFQSCANLALTELPESVTKIGMYAFRYCTKLALNKLPSNLTEIKSSVFQNCSNLALTELPNGLIYIRANAFQGCTNLNIKELPESLTTLEKSAFQGCTNLQLEKLSEGLTTIYSSTFQGCTNLVLTELPNSILSIGADAFRECSNLALKKLPDNLSSIAANSFFNCSSLLIKEIPVGVIQFNGSVFSGCASITELTCLGDITSFNAWTFFETGLEKFVMPNITAVPTMGNANCFKSTPIESGTGYIYVPDDLVESFKTATSWSTYANQIKPVSELSG